MVWIDVKSLLALAGLTTIVGKAHDWHTLPYHNILGPVVKFFSENLFRKFVVKISCENLLRKFVEKIC